jgi:hypothetical protein
MTNEEFDKILANAGISLPQRQKLKNAMVRAASSDSDDDRTAHLPRAAAVGNTLLSAGFDSDAVDQITRALVRGGYLHDDAGVVTMHASAANLSPVQRQGLRLAERFGVIVKNGSINRAQMDEAMSRHSVQDRLMAKTLWAQCGYID